MGLVASLVTFLIGALVGGLGIYIGAALIAGRGDYEHAVWTAIIGSFVWAVVGTLFGWIPLLGPGLTLIAYLVVISWRYGVGLVQAAGIALVAWLALLGVFLLLSPVGLDIFTGVGVPGV